MPAAQSTVNVSGFLITLGSNGLDYTPAAPVNTYAVAQSYSLALTTSPVLVTLPANTQWFGVQPPPSNAVAIHHKWAVGDTGSLVNATYGIPCLAVDPAGLTFYLWASGPVTVTIWSA